jgi:hypothetical protein
MEQEQLQGLDRRQVPRRAETRRGRRSGEKRVLGGETVKQKQFINKKTKAYFLFY